MALQHTSGNKMTTTTTTTVHTRRRVFVPLAVVLMAIGSNAFTASRPLAVVTNSRRQYRLAACANGTPEYFLPKRASLAPLPHLSAVTDHEQQQREFEMNIGKAVDTLRRDYPGILTKSPDFSIYSTDIEAVDPSGVTLNGLKNYKYTFRFLHGIVNWFYCPERSGLTFRMVYDSAHKNIRVSWNAEIIPKALFGGQKTTLHVDGISVYELDRGSGLIHQHRVERLVINDAAVRPKRGIFHALTNDIIDPDRIPVCNTKGNSILEFRSLDPLKNLLCRKQNTSLFSTSADEKRPGNFDNEAFERKNAYRKKFGLKPLTPDQFEEVEAQVREMDTQQRQRQAAATAASAAELKKKDSGFLQKIFGNAVTEDTCESNFDCVRPQVCCDFGFKKMCCSSGMKVLNQEAAIQRGERALVPVVAGYPPGPGTEDPSNY